MSHRLTVTTSLAISLLSGAAWAQGAPPPQLVGISVEGTVVEVPVDLAARACGVSAETLLEQWKQLDTQVATMAATSVAADATDLAPVASPEDTQRASGVGPIEQPVPGADAAATEMLAQTHAAPSGSDTSTAVAGASGDLSPVVAAASPEASAAENPQKALEKGAAPTEGTALSKAAVCEIDAARAAEADIQTPS